MRFKPWLRTVVSVLALIVIMGMGAPLAHAQYFGQNKVQYENFDYKVLKTEHFDIYFYPEMREAAEQAARMAERWYQRLSRVLGHELRGRQPLILYANAPHFQQTTTTPGTIGEGTGGFTEMYKRRIVLPLGPSLAASDHVIGHELVHAFQFDMTSIGGSAMAGGAPGAMSLPLWMIEGMAEYLSIGHDDAHTAMWMRDAVRQEKLPTIKKLQDYYEYFPYRWGQSLWSYITGKWGDDAVGRIVKSAGRMGGYEVAIRRVTGKTPEELSKDWQEAMNTSYKPLLEKTDVKDPNSRLLIQGDKYNQYNVSPAISPDGDRMVLLSTRDLFSIDLFLANAETGEFDKKLISTAANPDFESLQFIKSAGSWDSSGQKFVLGGITKGKPTLTILDMQRKKTEKEIKFDNIGEIFNPAWSPDGRTIVFSGQEAGVTDLYLYNLETEKLQQVMDDPYADLMPHWSPDGRTIAFVTERFTTDLPLLNIGRERLALLDVATRTVKEVKAFDSAKNLNPQWAPDSKSLYFISDWNGISNIYNVHLETGDITQVTNLYTGVSGITAESPAMTVAQNTGRLAYTLYEEGKFSIYSMELSDIEGIKVKPEAPEGVPPSILPPRENDESEILGLLKNPLFGLPEESEYEVEEYQPKLKLDYISQPQFGVGIDRWGTYAGGGITFSFSDMMGYHNLATSVMVTSRVEDSVTVLSYMNSRKRLNWGASISRIPYVYGSYYGAYNFQLGTYEEQELIFRQVYYDASTYAAYPLSRAQRVELWGGFRTIDFQYELRSRIYDMGTNILLDKRKEDLGAPESLYLGYANAALVYDTAIFGATAPILGQSYMLQVSPYIGTLNYWNLMADYRKYIMPVRPFTLAFRMMHYGRYGLSDDENRFYPIFMGYENMIRGYNYSSFSSNEGDVYNRLLGEKILVANLELRFPLFQILGIGSGWYGVWPIDFVAFFDSGLAWDYAGHQGDSRPWFMGGDMKPLSSVGAGIRMNLFGAIVLGVSYVRPLDRPERSSYFQFTIFPGF